MHTNKRCAFSSLIRRIQINGALISLLSSDFIELTKILNPICLPFFSLVEFRTVVASTRSSTLDNVIYDETEPVKTNYDAPWLECVHLWTSIEFSFAFALSHRLAELAFF